MDNVPPEKLEAAMRLLETAERIARENNWPADPLQWPEEASWIPKLWCDPPKE